MKLLLVILIILLLSINNTISIKIIIYIDNIDNIQNYCLNIGSALYTRNYQIRIISSKSRTGNPEIDDMRKIYAYYDEMYLLNDNDTVLISDGHNIIQRDLNDNDLLNLNEVLFATEIECWPFTHSHPTIYSCPLMQGDQYIKNPSKAKPRACTMLKEKAEKVDEANKDRLSIFLNSKLSIGKVYQYKKLFKDFTNLESTLPPLCKNYVGLLSWLYLQQDQGIKLDYEKKLLVSAYHNHLNFKFDYSQGLWMFGAGATTVYPLALEFHHDEKYYNFFYDTIEKYYTSNSSSIADKSISVNGKMMSFVDVCSENVSTTSYDKEDDACMYGYNIISKYESFISQFSQWRFGCICISKNKGVELKGWIKFTHYEYYKGQLENFFRDVSKNLELTATGCAFMRVSDEAYLPVDLAEELLKNGSPMLSHSFRKPARNIIFFPDFHFIAKRGFRDLISNITSGSKTELVKKVFWRGSTTGSVGKHCFDLPRYQVCNLSLSLPWCDFKISKVLPNNNCLNANIQNEMLSAYVDEFQWTKYSGILDIDGHVNAWGLLWRLASKSTLFHVESQYTNTYMELMLPWQHYIPIKADLSDLAEHTKLVISKNISDILMLNNIVENANKLAKSFTYESEVERVARELSVVWKLKDLEQPVTISSRKLS